MIINSCGFRHRVAKTETNDTDDFISFQKSRLQSFV